jgi:RNA polymerase sigma-70 factor, ECF subfamily
VASTDLEGSLIAAAALGDEDAFRRLFEPLAREMLVFCYRMLGSFQDAEDAVQETAFKAWRSLRSFNQQATFRTWLHRIAANTCLDLIKHRKRRVLPQDLRAPIVAPHADPLEWGPPGLDQPWLEPFPDSMLPANPATIVDQRESIRLAYIRALQILPARQRAVLILCDVLDWTSRDVAEALQASAPAVNSALQRARATMSRSRLGDGNRASIDEVELGANQARIAEGFVEAWEQGDVERLLSLLTDDAVQTMPPMLAWFQGTEALRDAYAIAWERNPRPGIFKVTTLDLNGQLAFASYHRPTGIGAFEALDLTVVTLTADGSRIRELTSFVRPDLFSRFGLPTTLHS